MKISPKVAKANLDRMKVERAAQRAPKPTTPTRTVPNTKPTPGRAAPSYGMTPSSVGIGTSAGIGIGSSAGIGIGPGTIPLGAGPKYGFSGPNFPISGPNYGFR